jgi:hypothetical protein
MVVMRRIICCVCWFSGIPKSSSLACYVLDNGCSNYKVLRRKLWGSRMKSGSHNWRRPWHGVGLILVQSARGRIFDVLEANNFIWRTPNFPNPLAECRKQRGSIFIVGCYDRVRSGGWMSEWTNNERIVKARGVSRKELFADQGLLRQRSVSSRAFRSSYKDGHGLACSLRLYWHTTWGEITIQHTLGKDQHETKTTSRYCFCLLPVRGICVNNSNSTGQNNNTTTLKNANPSTIIEQMPLSQSQERTWDVSDSNDDDATHSKHSCARWAL